MRRKHFTNWIPYLNILNDWSTEYRFFAKYTKLLLNTNLLNYSYISFNTLRIGSYSREFVNLFTKFKGASSLNSINSYFRTTTSSKLNTNFIKNNALLYVNSTKSYTSTDDAHFSPLYLQNQNLVYAPNSVDKRFEELSFIRNIGFIYSLAYTKELYKILILLCFFQNSKQ